MPRRRWTKIPDTPARHSYDCVEHDGVTVLRVVLAGHADNTPDGVARVRDALDALAASLTPAPAVATLDVAAFANASDDACSLLTSVFEGVPCCWITAAWDQQLDGRRWDLPPSGRMAPTAADALARVVGWRHAGEFSLRLTADYTREWRWTDRGLVIRDRRNDKLERDDLYYRNQLVERALHDGPVRILWPTPDGTGLAHAALRAGARLELEGDRIVAADFSPWSTDRPLPADWLERLAELSTITTLSLRGTAAREPDILHAVRALPELRRLELDRDTLSPEARAALRRERPDLDLR